MRLRTFLLALLVLALALTGTAAAEDPDADPALGISATADVVSTYYWRGFDLTDHEPAFQPGVTLTHNASGLSLNLWGSIALDDRSTTRDVDELDLTVGLDRSVGEALDVSLGAIFYFYPQLAPEEDSTEEIYAGLGFPSAPLSPTITYFQDLNLGDGGYLLIGGSHSVGALTLSADSGFSFKQYTDKTGFTELVLGASYDFVLGSSGAYLTPYVRFAAVDDKERNPDNTEFWFGLSLGWDR
jgi:uncharacterized protein (TIGR02001 family)